MKIDISQEEEVFCSASEMEFKVPYCLYKTKGPEEKAIYIRETDSGITPKVLRLCSWEPLPHIVSLRALNKVKFKRVYENIEILISIIGER